MAKPTIFARIKPDVLAAVDAIPPGRVTTYGAIARTLGVSPRHIAYVLARLGPSECAELPWHRVVGAGGAIRTTASRREQVRRLRAEGLSVTARDRVGDFDATFWQPE